jgi:adenosylcobinamide kinase/adenosylcobinamide-phosphate guanylyltransferase
MGKLILITGGARSGKSSFAEEKAKELGDRILYIATSIPLDDEMKLRIQKHRAQRPSEWETLEAYRDINTCLEGRLEKKDGVLLDCLTIMVTNIMLEEKEDWDNLTASEIDAIEDIIKIEVEKLIDAVKKSPSPFIVVTNETGMGVVPGNPLTRAFRDFVGRANQMTAKEAQEVYLCVSGIPVRIK